MDGTFAHRKIDDFLLQDLIGRRTTIDMYRATQESLKRLVLVKVISFSAVSESDDQLTHEFRDYVRAVIGLEHIHLQPIYGYGVIDDDHVYVAGRLIVGSLYDLLQVGALPLEQSLMLALQVVSALIYLHERGFIHKSLSPHNIYIGDDGNSYINDLELAPLVQSAKSLDELEKLFDEPFYNPPEQLQLMNLDVRSEVYTFGAILYHMVTGVPPYSDAQDGFETVLKRKLSNEIIAPRYLAPAIPLTLEETLLQMLRANPAERFPDFKALEGILKQQIETLEPDIETTMGKLRSFFGRLRPM